MMVQYEVMFAGFGGQGIMTAGQLLAYAGIAEGKQVAWIPSYGPEMRGGTAYCTVVISDNRIGSPIVTTPTAVCVFNRPSFDKFEPRVKPHGLFIVNSSLINVASRRSDITQLLIPANDLAMKAGSAKAANMAVLGAFIGSSGLVKYETVQSVIREKMGKKEDLLNINFTVLEAGYQLALASVGERQTT
ncbi:MAG TPA: 2-oxoacid:acceptor oxidoreductase family protein [Candidatus Deferrimicrobium sp.]|nr:2-oxoacid:acceptor oxidoreductase family protein [Candidatus Deferrimicrobium sp.]